MKQRAQNPTGCKEENLIKNRERSKTICSLGLIFAFILLGIIIVTTMALAKYVIKDEKDIEVTLRNVRIGENEIEIIPSSWTNENVAVSINTKKNGEVYYKINENGEWKKYEKNFEVEENCNIYTKIKYTDGESPETVKEVTNIDKIKPTVEIVNPKDPITPDIQEYTILAGETTTNISKKLIANDEGGSGLKTLSYAYSQSNTTEPTTYEEFKNEAAVTKSATGGNWYIWTKVLDNAGNRAEETKVSPAYNVGYQISYDANGGTGAPKEQRKVHGTELKISEIIPTRTGYEFQGWATATTATTAELKAGGNYTTDKAVKLYAVWKKYKYLNTTTSKYYMKLSDALNEVKDKETIKAMDYAIETTAPTLATAKAITFDLNGQTVVMSNVTLTNNGTLTIAGTNGTLTGSGADTITNNGTLIKNTATEVASSATADYYVIKNNGTATISAGKLTSSYGGIYNGTSAKLSVTGGTFNTACVNINNYSTLNTEENPSVLIDGEPSLTATEGNVISNAGDGLIHIKNGTMNMPTTSGTPTVINCKSGKIIISGGTIKMAGGNAAVFNGYSGTGNAEGTIEIRGGTIESTTSKGINVFEKTKLIVSGGYINSYDNGINQNGMYTSVIVTGGTIVSTKDGCSGIAILSGPATITGGTITGKKNGVWTNNTNPRNVTLGTNDGKVSVTSPDITGGVYGINAQEGTTFNFYDGKLTGAKGNSISGTVTETATNCVVVKTTSGSTETAVLGPSAPVITAKLDDANGATYTGGTWTNHNIWVQLKSASIGAGIKEFQWYENGAWTTRELTTNNNVGMITYTATRNETIRFRAIDNNGVISYEAVLGIKIDKTAPTISSVTPATTWDYSNDVTVNATDNESISAYAVTTTNTSPTEWIETTNIDLSNVQTKRENGASWARVFYHNNRGGSTLFANETEAKSVDVSYKYSALGTLDNYKDTTGNWEFMLQYPEIKEKYNRWKQTGNPATTTIANGDGSANAPGYSAVHIDWNQNYWGGLTKSTASETFINGSVGYAWWQYAIGAYQAWNGGIPGPSNPVFQGTELWSRIDSLTKENKKTLTAKVGNLTTNGTYYVWVKDHLGNVSSKAVTTNKVDTTAPSVTITRTDYNTFSWKASDSQSGILGYAITTSNSAPTSWTTSGTITSGTKDVGAAGTYYVWVKDNVGNIGSASITAYTMTRSQGTGSTLTTRIDGTSATTGTAVTVNTVVLSGTPVWAIATANTGYNTPVLKNGTTLITASGTKVTITADTTISSIATVNTYTVKYNGNGNTGGSTVDSTHTYNVAKALTSNGFTKTNYSFAGWSTSNATTAQVYETAEYTASRASTTATGTYVTVKEYFIKAPFTSGDIYQLDFDVKGSGKMTNFFYGNANYLQVAKTERSDGVTNTRTDGGNDITLTSNYKHYTTKFTLGSTGTTTVDKRLLFRLETGEATAYVKNIRLIKIASSAKMYNNAQSVSNLSATNGATVNLYAVWAPNRAQIKFMRNISSTDLTSASQSFIVGVSGQSFSAKGWTNTGYTLKGWSASKTATTASWTVTSGVADAWITESSPTRTIYAVWEANKYKVTLDNQGATTAGTTAYWYKYKTTTTVNGTTIYYYADEAMTASPMSGSKITVPTKTGYTFGGYYTATNGGGTMYVDANGVCQNNIYSNVAGNTTLYAKWTLNTYTISYNLAGGSVATANPTSYNVTSNTITLNNPTRTGYTFLGWTGSNDISSGLSYTTSSPYSAAGRDHFPGNAFNVTAGSTYRVMVTAKRTKGSVDLRGGIWYTAQSTGAAYDGYGLFTLAETLSDGWARYYRDVTVPTGKTQGKIFIQLEQSSSTGFTTAWSIADMSVIPQTTTTTIPKGSVGNRSYRANWKINSYTVTYNYSTNGGTSATKTTASVAYGSNVDLTPTATKSGWTFVGWSDPDHPSGTTKLTSYKMPAKNVTLYAIYSKTLTGTFKYYNNQTKTVSTTIYNTATSGAITAPAALGTPSGYTFRHWSTATAANAAKTVAASGSITISANTTYYASYQQTVTATFYYHPGTDQYAISQSSTTASGTKYMGYTGGIVNGSITIPTAVSGSTGIYGTKYAGVSTATNSLTAASVTTANTKYYAYYDVGVTYYYWNGSKVTASNPSSTRRRALSNGSNYALSATNVPSTTSAYDSASFKNWTYDLNTIYDRTPTSTASTTLYAYYQKSVTATFHYTNGSTAQTAQASGTKSYITNTSSMKTVNGNITVPTAVSTNRTLGGRTIIYNGVSTSSAVNATNVTPTTANTTYYANYRYSITVTFDSNGATSGKSDPKPITGNVYCNYTLGRIGLSVKMPDNTEEYALVKSGVNASYTFSGWNSKNDGTGTAYSANTSYTFYDSTTVYVRWFRPVYKNTTTNKTYDILNYAINEAKTNEVIQMQQNSNTEPLQAEVTSGKTIYLELNGKTLTTKESIRNNGILYVNHKGSTSGTINYTGTNVAVLSVSNSLTSLQMKNATITSNGMGIQTTVNAIILSKVKVTSKKEGIKISAKDCVSTIESCTVNATYSGVQVVDGRAIITSSNITGDYGVFNFDGYIQIENNSIIKGTTYAGIINWSENAGTTHVGTRTATFSTTSEQVTGKTYGVQNTGSKSYMYLDNGRVQGELGATNGALTTTRSGYTIYTTTSGSYKVIYLKAASSTKALSKIATMRLGRNRAISIVKDQSNSVDDKNSKEEDKQSGENQVDNSNQSIDGNEVKDEIENRSEEIIKEDNNVGEYNKEQMDNAKMNAKDVDDYEKEYILLRYEENKYSNNPEELKKKRDTEDIENKTLWIDQTENKLDAIITNANWKDKYLEFNGETTFGTLDKINTKALTIETTISCTKLPKEDDECIIGDAQNNTELLYVTKEGNIKAKLKIGEKEYEATSIQKLEENKVYGITLTYDGKKLVIYINGKEDVRIEIEEGKKFFDNELKLIIGAKSNEKTEIGTDTNEDDNTENDENVISNYFYGNMYTFSIYNEAIDEEKILNNYIYNSKLIEQE